MPAKQTTLTDEERARRIRETAREIGAEESAEAFEQAFRRVVPTKPSIKAPRAKGATSKE
jgi:hypothetical protein